MSTHRILAISLVSIVFVFSSCRIVYRTLLGVDSTPSWKFTEQISKGFEKQKISSENRFILDTASYYNSVISILKNRKKYLTQDSLHVDSSALKQVVENAKNDLQPVQIRYFTKSGKPIFKMINCYVDQLFPMSWNVDSCFDSFPPKPIKDLAADTNEHLSFFLDHITTTEGDKVDFSKLPKTEYYALVFCNKFMIRPSRTLIKQLKKYQLQYPDEKTFFLYVNNQNASIWQMANTDQKSEIKKHIKEEQSKN